MHRTEKRLQKYRDLYFQLQLRNCTVKSLFNTGFLMPFSILRVTCHFETDVTLSIMSKHTF